MDLLLGFFGEGRVMLTVARGFLNLRCPFLKYEKRNLTKDTGTVHARWVLAVLAGTSVS